MPSNPLDRKPHDYAAQFQLASPVIVLGSVMPPKAFPDKQMPKPWATKKSTRDWVPAGYEEYVIVITGYPVGLVYFREGEGSEEKALTKWNDWPLPIDLQCDLK